MAIFPFLDPNVTKKFGPPSDEWKGKAFRHGVIGELMGSFLFLFVTISTVLYTADVIVQTSGLTISRQLMISTCFGTMISILVFIFAGISGGNINPAVSFGLYLTGKISGLMCISYMIVQCIGASFGVLAVKSLDSDLFKSLEGAHNEISPNHTLWESALVEFLLTGFLMLVVMAATDNSRTEAHKHLPVIAPIIVGWAVTVAHFVAIPVDNCSINPARSFSTSLISNHWEDHYVFWLFPLLGSGTTALIYNLFFQHTHEDFDLNTTPKASARKLGATNSELANLKV